MGKPLSGPYGREMKIRIPADIRKQLEEIAGRRRTSLSEIVREACLDYARQRSDSISAVERTE